VRILRRSFTIYDTDDAQRVMKATPAGDEGG